MDDGTIGQFMSVTGCTKPVAQTWLEMGGYVLDDAVSLYFANNQSSNNGGASGSSSSSSSSMASAAGTHHNRGAYGDDDFGDEDVVRRPDPVRNMQLVSDHGRSMEYRPETKISSVFNAGNEFRPRSSKEQTLAKLYKAPQDLMFQGDLEEAKDAAKSGDKWLLVNIQSDKDFECHTLNRDVWSDECVKDMVLCSFIFWQHLDVSPHGQTFIDRYKVDTFPWICILDPRTGASVWKHTGKYKRDTLTEKIQDFLGDNPFPSESSFNRKRRPNTGQVLPTVLSTEASIGAAAHTSSGNNGNEEDAALAAAIAMSMQEQPMSSANKSSNSTRSSSSSRATKAPVVDSASGDNDEEGIIAPHSGQKRGAPDSNSLPAVNGDAKKGRTFSAFSVRDMLDNSLAPPDTVSGGGGSSSSSSADDDNNGEPINLQFRCPGNVKVSQQFSSSTSVLELLHFVTKTLKEKVPAVSQTLDDATAEYRFDVFFSFPRKSMCDIVNALTADNSDKNLSNISLADADIKTQSAFSVERME